MNKLTLVLVNKKPNEKHESLSSLHEFAKMSGIACFTTLNKWSKKIENLPRHKAFKVQYGREVRMYSLSDLKEWHERCKNKCGRPDQVGATYNVNY